MNYCSLNFNKNTDFLSWFWILKLFAHLINIFYQFRQMTNESVIEKDFMPSIHHLISKIELQTAAVISMFIFQSVKQNCNCACSIYKELYLLTVLPLSKWMTILESRLCLKKLNHTQDTWHFSNVTYKVFLSWFSRV